MPDIQISYREVFDFHEAFKHIVQGRFGYAPVDIACSLMIALTTMIALLSGSQILLTMYFCSLILFTIYLYRRYSHEEMTEEDSCIIDVMASRSSFRISAHNMEHKRSSQRLHSKINLTTGNSNALFPNSAVAAAATEYKDTKV